jgi:hypothetical protein
MTEDERLVRFLKEGKDWERKTTNIPGLFLLKIPPSRSNSSSVYIEINPVDSFGAPTKKRGIIIRSASELQQISEILTNPKLTQLATVIDEINPKSKSSSSKTDTDIFEI